MTNTTCPKCGNPIGGVLKGSYSHFPDAYFCEKCVRFIEAPKEKEVVQPKKEQQ